MALDPSQLTTLLSVLSEENTSNQTLETIGNTFHQFFSKPDFFKIGCAIVTLLQNRDLIVHQTQRIVCVYFLYDMYRNDTIALNPFVSVFTNLVSPPTITANNQNKEYNWSMPRLTPQEKYFVSQLITSPSKELFKKTATQILQMDPSGLSSADISGLQVSIAEKLLELPHMSKIGLPCVVSDNESSRNSYDEFVAKNGSEQQRQCLDNLLVGPDAPFRKSIRPEFIRLAPPLHMDQDELIWLDPIDYMPEFCWDTTILNCSTASSNTSEIRKLMTKACRSQLNITQLQELESALAKDSNLILYLDITPEKFASLVEYNPQVAVKVILAYSEQDSYHLTPYFEELIKMKMSLHSMEVVNDLAMSVILPDEFIHLYISNCISKCESMTDDKPLQSRLVRLLCVFIQSLIRNKILDVKELHIELQPFCIEFSSIREANSLYRVLKSTNSENPISSGGGSSSGSQTSNPQSSLTKPSAVGSSQKNGKS